MDNEWMMVGARPGLVLVRASGLDELRLSGCRSVFAPFFGSLRLCVFVILRRRRNGNPGDVMRRTAYRRKKKGRKKGTGEKGETLCYWRPMSWSRLAVFLEQLSQRSPEVRLAESRDG